MLFWMTSGIPWMAGRNTVVAERLVDAVLDDA
jgi:hypothetical protein